jgi:hypothetical protein
MRTKKITSASNWAKTQYTRPKHYKIHPKFTPHMLEEEEEVNKENVLHVKRQPTLKRKPNSSRKEISHMAPFLNVQNL